MSSTREDRAAAPEAVKGATLRRELRPWEAIALSVGIMAPTLAMGLNGVLPASLVGRAVPLVFLLGFVGVAFVAYSFVRLSRHFSHAGSVYALAGVTLGPRAGFFGGFALFGVYVMYSVSTLAATALFAKTFLVSSGLWADVPWFPLALLTAVGVWVLSARDVRVAARVLLSLEGLGIALIVVLVAVILGTVLGTGPRGQTFDLAAFTPTEGTGASAVLAATVFAFLSWAGFEGAASLGEETGDPRRNIPRALVWALGITGVFYVVTMFAESVGFGTDAAGAERFAASSAPLGDLARTYLNATAASVLDFAAMASAFASCMSTTVAASRILFAMSRDGLRAGSPLSKTSPSTGAPVVALATVLLAAVVIFCGIAASGTHNPTDIYFYAATLGTLGILVVYAVTSVGGIRFLFLGRRAPLWHALFPTLAIAYLGYVFYKQVYPVPDSPYNVFPYLAAAWLALGFLLVVARPALARRVGEGLERAEGFAVEERR